MDHALSSVASWCWPSFDETGESVECTACDGSAFVECTDAGVEPSWPINEPLSEVESC